MYYLWKDIYKIKSTFIQKAKLYSKSKPLLLEPTAHDAENKKNPSRNQLRGGLFHLLKQQTPLKSRLFGNEKGSTLFYQNMLPYLVEMRRIELLSEITQNELSTSVENGLF